MSRFWSDTTRRISPYIPGEQPQDKEYIKLNTNENPYPPSPRVFDAINRALSNLRRYPDPEGMRLREVIASYHNLEVQQVFVSNGSDELLAFAFMAFFMPDRPVIYPDITYTFYEVYASLFKIRNTLIPLNEDFSIDIKPYCTNGAGVIIANPNAPTGITLNLKEIETILASNPDNVVIIDEAYIDFGGETSYGFINKFPNLLVVQTLSKSRSLAGLRVGFAMGSQELIEGLCRIKNSVNSYPLDRLALEGAIAAIEDDQYFQETRQRIINTREHIKPSLREMGFEVLDSKANFLFISHNALHAGTLFRELKDAGVLTRHFQRPRIENFLRVTIGTEDEMRAFLSLTKDIIKKQHKSLDKKIHLI